MYQTPAQIISSVFVGLGKPESELLQESEVAQVVFRKLAYYYEGIRQSDQNLMTNVTDAFTLSAGSNTKDLTTLTSSSIITPLWCERKIYDGANDFWEFVPTVNLDTLEEKRANYLPAVAYYGSTANQITAVFSLYGDDVDAPHNTYRIWYAPGNSFTNNKDATLSIPDNLCALVVVDSQLNCIDPLINNAAKYLEKRPGLAARIAAWQASVPRLEREKMEWTVLWESWRKRSRGAHRAINHTDVLGLD